MSKAINILGKKHPRVTGNFKIFSFAREVGQFNFRLNSMILMFHVPWGQNPDLTTIQ